MPTVNMHDAKSNLSKLVQAVASGETAEVVIARNGVPAARLVPVKPVDAGQRIGIAKGRVLVPDDIDRSNAEVAELFLGGSPALRLLLDTHVALWAIADSPRLSARARELILEPDNEIWVSAASLWEIAIKHALGRGDMPISGEAALRYFRQARYGLLPVAPEHAASVERLPPLHADPFDRLLLAQARYEPLRLLSADEKVALYGPEVERV